MVYAVQHLHKGPVVFANMNSQGPVVFANMISLSWCNDQKKKAMKSVVAEEESVVAELDTTRIAFLEGMLYHLLAWAPVLFATVKNVIEYPDMMPMPVWIAVFGIFAFYSTFVIAQCTTVVARIESLSMQGPDRYEVFRYFAVNDPKTLSYIATGMFTDLTLGVLFSVPDIRDFFGLHPEVSVAEPWALMSFFVLTAFLSALVSRLHPRIAFSETPSIGVEFFLYCVYAITVTMLWLGWGFMLNLVGATEAENATAWIVVFTILAIAFVVYTVVVWWTSEEPKSSHMDPADSSQVKQEANRLCVYHKAGIVLHSVLIIFTVLVGVVKGENYGGEWVGARLETYLFTPNWHQISLAKNETYRASLRLAPGTSRAGDGTRRALDYCVLDTTVPIYVVAVALCWSSLSLAQHVYSYKCMLRINDKDSARAAGAPVSWDGVGKPPVYNALRDFQAAVAAKWIEYSVSATLMHIVVMRYAGILSFFQLVILASLLSASMMAGYRMERHMNAAMDHGDHRLSEVLPKRCLSHLQSECEFVLLSFYAKAILTMVLVVTILFLGKSQFEVIPAVCNPPM